MDGFDVNLQVRSPPLTKSIVMIRIKLATQTLPRAVNHNSYEEDLSKFTHNAPRAKIPESATF